MITNIPCKEFLIKGQASQTGAVISLHARIISCAICTCLPQKAAEALIKPDFYPKFYKQSVDITTP
jgi:hypothetical protein